MFTLVNSKISGYAFLAVLTTFNVVVAVSTSYKLQDEPVQAEILGGVLQCPTREKTSAEMELQACRVSQQVQELVHQRELESRPPVVKAQGGVGEACYGNATCNSGLECRRDMCFPVKETVVTSDAGEEAATLKTRLGKMDVMHVVRRYNGRIKQCGSASNSQNFKGKIWVKFDIAPSGKVASASIASRSFDGTDLGNCILSVVRGMEFDKATKSTPISKYPFFI